MFKHLIIAALLITVGQVPNELIAQKLVLHYIKEYYPPSDKDPVEMSPIGVGNNVPGTITIDMGLKRCVIENGLKSEVFRIVKMTEINDEETRYEMEAKWGDTIVPFVAIHDKFYLIFKLSYKYGETEYYLKE